MAELLFAPAVTGLLHLPDVLERLAAVETDHRADGEHTRHHAAHGHGHGHPRAHGLGGGVPVDIVETPGEYAFLLDVPVLSKSDIQFSDYTTAEFGRGWSFSWDEDSLLLHLRDVLLEDMEVLYLSLDFENFHCLPLSPVPDIYGDIINGCSLVDCLKHFTVLEQLDNYRCDHYWRNAAAKYFSLKLEVDELQLQTVIWPRENNMISCIHLLRASVSLSGKLIKRGGHGSFPLLLDLSPFAGGTFSTGQEPGPSAMNMQKYDLPSLHLYRQLNAQMPINLFSNGWNSSSQPRKVEVSNDGGCSLYKGNVDMTTSTSSSWSTSFSSRKELYTLSAVIEHYGICGGGFF